MMDLVVWAVLIGSLLAGLGVRIALDRLPRIARPVYDLLLHLAAFVGFLYLGATRVPPAAKDWPFAVTAMTISAVLIGGVVRTAAPLLPRLRRRPTERPENDPRSGPGAAL